jgi:hypothetical protein
VPVWEGNQLVTNSVSPSTVVGLSLIFDRPRMDGMQKDGVLLAPESALSTGSCVPRSSVTLVCIVTVASPCTRAASNLQ